jgi:membrane-associated protein
LEFLKNLTDPVWISNHGGLYIVVLIIFAETGLFVGFFLPGDSLLFITGMIIANSLAPFDSETANLIYWMALITIAGIVGNSVGYWFGKKSGPLLFERRETWIFKRKHVLHAKEFYDKKGGGAIILARFLPIVRTFAPIVAGVVKMDPKKFMFFNVVGSVLWVVSLVLAGYLLGGNIWVKENLEYILIGIVVVTTAPVLMKLFFSKKKDPTLEVAQDIVEEKLNTPSE